MKKINIFLPPIIDIDEADVEFVNTNWFVCELEYPYDIDWNADEREFENYIRRQAHKISQHMPIFYRDRIVGVSLRDTIADKSRFFYMVLCDDCAE